MPVTCAGSCWPGALSSVFFGHSISFFDHERPRPLRCTMGLCAAAKKRPLPLRAPRVCSLLAHVGPPGSRARILYSTNTLTPVSGHGVAAGLAPCHGATVELHGTRLTPMHCPFGALGQRHCGVRWQSSNLCVAACSDPPCHACGDDSVLCLAQCRNRNLRPYTLLIQPRTQRNSVSVGKE